MPGSRSDEPVGGRSIAFDRVADVYDATRSLPPRAMRQVVSQLAAELAGRGPCLEIGVGTGRLALPLAVAGVELTGVDISAPMLARLVAKAGGRAPFPLALADATALPFPDATFGGALAAHVLHLIPSWREAVRQVVRVLAPGGVFLVDLGGIRDPGAEEIEDRLGEEAGVSARARVGLTQERAGDLEDELAAMGCRSRGLPRVRLVERMSVDRVIRQFEDGVYSWTWSLDQGTRRRAAEATRRWAVGRYGDLTKLRPFGGTIAWRAFDLP